MSDVDGVPCFAVSGPEEAAEEMRFETLYVSDHARPTKDWRTLPPEMWAIDVLPPGASLPWKSNACIPYGELAPGATVRTPARDLDRHRVYSVFIGARTKHDRGNVLGYRASFCIVPTVDGKSAVHEIEWDAKAQRWRSDVCDKK